MMHLEQEKLNGKLKEVMFQKQFWIKLIWNSCVENSFRKFSES
jgi:hypothetical protein